MLSKLKRNGDIRNFKNSSIYKKKKKENMVLLNQLNIYLYTFDKIHNQCNSHLDYGTYSLWYNISGDLLFVHM